MCGKKLAYPLGKFVTMLRNQAIRFDSIAYKSKNKLKLDIQETKTDGIMIYQKASDARGEHLFYALSVVALEDENVNSYSTFPVTQEQSNKFSNNTSKTI